ncbi:MAG: hypothetical protein HY682_05065 [Chloroflexi bacterium]|nr:hypothetical protein [Chloroflexota bacterium]
MPDEASNWVLVIVALTGTGAALAGTLIGHFATVWATSQNLKHQREESARNRRIDARRSWLVNLQDATARSFEIAEMARAAYVAHMWDQWRDGLAQRAGSPAGTVLDTPQAAQNKRNHDAALQALNEVRFAVRTARAHNGDGDLGRELDRFDAEIGTVDGELTIAAANWYLASNAPLQAAAAQRYDSLVKRARSAMLPVNRQIERLLEGVENAP